MNIVVLGCGGIGGTLAACLTRAGARVTPVTGNPEIARALATDGFRVRDFQSGEAEWSVMPSVAPRVSLDDGGPSPAAPFDVCIVATQNTTMEAALASVRPHLADGAVVLCCQNGLPEDRAARVVGRSRVLGCVVGWGASMVAPGHYKRTSKGVLTVGRPFEEAPDPTALAPLIALLGAASPVLVAPDLAAVRWSKLAINCVTTTIGAVAGLPLGPLLRHRFARRVALEVFAEVAATARAIGVRPAPIANTFAIEKVAISDEERRQRIGSPSLALKHSLLLAVGFKYRRMRSSMLYALERGRPPEIESLNAEVVRRAAALGVPTPVNARLVEMIHRLAADREHVKPSLVLLRAIYDEVVVPGEAARLARAA